MNGALQSGGISTERCGLSPLAPPTLFNKNSWAMLRESIDLFFKSLTFGRVRGIARIVDFPNAGSGNDLRELQLIRELIGRDILVTVSGFEPMDISKTEITGPDLLHSAGDGISELCDFIGINPVLHISDAGDSADSLKFYTELAQRAAAALSELPFAVISSGPHGDQTERVGTFFTMGKDPLETADAVDTDIHNKRLGVSWCDRCGGRFSPFS